ncbi:Calcium-transporting ATPase [Aquirufa nivalisilvae]|uniref:Magnesium-transporting ATPase, P-type 1 n=1 Tax=Aquirufa nivalisilvae TaxID=2516557 RepID=A0A2S2DYG3_9BACT|nr:magnesium-translocating P-type ATPase [Aquirufa nivalisilvae]AWL10406.1 Calcium-transporting ATPase [Aquirufa nivalisilvae]
MKNEVDLRSFWSIDPAICLQELASSNEGLSSSQAKRIYQESLKTKRKIHPWEQDVRLFLTQFKSPLMLLLLGAVCFSAFLGDTSDVIIILFIVISTGLLSFFQERNAERVVAKLQSLISNTCQVVRDNSVQVIKSEQLVPGDIILFKAGDIIPGDCILFESNELYTNEASLTGESFPVYKSTELSPANSSLAQRKNALWEGSNVVSGTAKALVIYTGEDTVFGSIVKSSNDKVETSFEKGIKDFGFLLMKITLILSFFILVVNLFNHKNVLESALFALALSVGMAPELLPAITTIAMSAGAKRLLEKKVIVKKLSSIQNLGEVNLLCTDKTGTITEGAIVVESIVDFSNKESEYAKSLAFWNASLEAGYSNPIDEAIKLQPGMSGKLPKKLGEIPYDFIRKRLSIALEGEESLLVTKGAFAQIIQICTRVRGNNGEIFPIETFQEAIQNQYEQFGIEGMRVIAVCYKKWEGQLLDKSAENEMVFAGFILLKDPIKSGILEAIDALKQLHVGIKIITGDNRHVAHAIALKMGIVNPIVITGEDLIQMSSTALDIQVKQAHIFAEVEPQQKERIILALRHSYTVAYMGDGINDVSAISVADVGISVENAVDITKSAADFVLLEKDLSVLIDGIKEGRKTFANTLKYIYINTGSTFGNMFSVAFASLLLPFLPMLPKQILMTNFITDFPYLSIASDNVDEEQLAWPGKWNLKFISRYMIIFGLHSSLFDIMTFLLLYYVVKAKEATFQTSWFIESILTELFILFIIRTHKNFFKSKPGKYLLILSVFGLLITLGLPYSYLGVEFGLVPISMLQLGLMLAIVFAYILTADILKVWFFSQQRNR